METKQWSTDVRSQADQTVKPRQTRIGEERRAGGAVIPRSCDALSRREREVLSLIALGKTDRQIADDLYISRVTVSNHVVHILDKLDVPNRTSAAILAATSALARPVLHLDFAGNEESS